MVPIALIKLSPPDILDSIVVSIPACHAGDQGSIPCRGDLFRNWQKKVIIVTWLLWYYSWLAYAFVAQWLEHWSCKPGVVSSNLTEGFWKSWQYLHLNNNAKTKEVDKSSPNVGLEPTTLRLRVSCSTDWASRAYLLWFFWIKGWCRLMQDWRIMFRLKKRTHPWYQ